MRSRKERRTARSQAARTEAKRGRDIEHHFRNLKEAMANAAHPAFRDTILQMNKSEFADFLTIFNKTNNMEEDDA